MWIKTEVHKMSLKKVIRQTFLFRVYQFNKKLFLFFAAFAGLSVLGNLAGYEITPFFVWGMYSQKETPQDNYEIYKITVNNDILDYSDGFLPENRLFLQLPLHYYSLLKNGIDPTEVFLRKKLKENYEAVQPYISGGLNSAKDIKEFPLWYKRYLHQATGEAVDNYTVEVLQVSYRQHKLIQVDSIYTLIDGK